MSKEIGGYFELEQFDGAEYYPKLIALNTARNALVYLIRAKKIKKLYIPIYLCDSVSRACEKEGCLFEYYNIDEAFFPKFTKKLNQYEYLYVVNYFGFIDKRAIKKLKAKHKNIIVDNVQDFFQKPIKGIDTIYSCRKFFGVPDGAYLSTDVQFGLDLKIDKSRDRFKHLLGRVEEEASSFYNDFKANDEAFNDEDLCFMSKLTHNILRGINYKKVIKKRNQNCKILRKELGEKNRLNVRSQNGAYCYPFYCENGIETRKKLAKAGIFVPTLWPNVLDCTACDLEKDYVKNILPLPIDQRYGKKDMLKVVAAINKDCNE